MVYLLFFYICHLLLYFFSWALIRFSFFVYIFIYHQIGFVSWSQISFQICRAFASSYLNKINAFKMQNKELSGHLNWLLFANADVSVL